jgi:hypothetical protein
MEAAPDSMTRGFRVKPGKYPTEKQKKVFSLLDRIYALLKVIDIIRLG